MLILGITAYSLEVMWKTSLKSKLWSSYSEVLKNLKFFKEINSVRGLRYFGPSQMSLFKLVVHSL